MSDSNSHSATVSVAVGVTLGVLGAVLIAGIIYGTLRIRRRTHVGAHFDWAERMPRGSAVLERTHPAARITPFGSPNAVDAHLPRYGHSHRPGENMRIAYRGDDGGWYFSRPASPSMLRTGSAPELDKIPPSLSLDKGGDLEYPPRASKLGYLKMDRVQRSESVTPPPPAYTAGEREAV